MTQILSDIVETVVDLRQEHELMEKEAPVQWLDANQPNWREHFPLPIDDAAGRALLKGLIDAASKAKKDRDEKNPIEVERFLIHSDTSSPELVAQIEFPNFVYFESIGFDELPSALNLEIVEPNGTVWPLCRAIQTNYREKKALRLSGKTLKITGLDAAKELMLRFKSIGGIIKDLPLVNGHALDIQTPWLFKKIEDKWVVHGISSQSIKDDTALAYIPASYSVTPEGEDTILSNCGDLFDGGIIKFSGDLLCNSEDTNFKFSAGTNESTVQYQLSGRRLLYSSVPSEIFIGAPNLLEINTVTETSKVNRAARLVAKPIGVEQAWRPLNNVNTGYYDVRLLDDKGNIQLRKRIGILSSDFKVKARPDQKLVSSGVIQIDDIGSCDVNISQYDGLHSQVVKNSTVTDIEFHAEGTPPLSVNISLLPKDHRQDLLLTLPFPSQGAQLFNSKGEQVPLSTSLFLNDLKGYRFKIYSDSLHAKAELRFSLIDSSKVKEDLRDIYIQRKISLTSEHTEFVIDDWMPFIESLMSVSPSLDAKVKISLILAGQREYGFYVGRYDSELLPVFADGVIELRSTEFCNVCSEILENISVSVIFLNQPEQNFLDLCPEVSEGTFTGRWLFNPEKRDDGPWIIYPHQDSYLQFRPLLWNVGDGDDPEDISEIDSLPKAIRIANHCLREQAIRRVLQLMALDGNHKSWGFLDSLWKKTNHLPLGTFDLWKIVISEYGFLACLFLKDRDDIIEKLANELPLLWELIPLDTWDNALSSYKEKLVSTFDEDELDLVNDFLGRKIKKIEEELELLSTGKVLRFRLLGEQSPDLRSMRMTLPVFKQFILNDKYQNLLRRQSENYDWPKLLKTSIDQKLSEVPTEYHSLIENHNQFQFSVVYLPIVLAWQALSTGHSEWPNNSSDLFKIQQLIKFDEEWFDSIYQPTLAWLSQQKQH